MTSGLSQRGGRSTGWVPRVVVLGLVLGLILGLVGLGFFLVSPRSGSADDTAASRAVVSRVTDFAVKYNTYDVANLKQYQDSVGPLLTTKYRGEFEQVTTALFQAIQDKKQSSGDADVKDVAVTDQDDDSATAIVAVDAKVSNSDNANAVERRFRWRVSLVKADGQWRVNSFESVAAQPASGAEVTPTPTGPTATGPAPTGTAPTGGATTPSGGGD